MAINITEEYLEDFAIHEIIKQPIKHKLHGWEIDYGNASIALDDPDGHYISYIHWDDNDNTKQWKLKPGTDKRWTWVMLTKNSEVVGDIGWEFEGLIDPMVLRAWFISHLGFAAKKG